MGSGIRQYIRHTMPLELAEFLRANKCTEKYITNLYNSKAKKASALYKKKNCKYYNYLADLINATFYNGIPISYTIGYSITTVLERSFNFPETPEGIHYWLTLYFKALDYQRMYK